MGFDETAYKRELRQTCRELHVCQQCYHRDAMPGGAYCGRCLEVRNDAQAVRKVRYVEAGLCSRCGRTRDNKELRMCSACRERYREYYRQRRARTAASDAV